MKILLAIDGSKFSEAAEKAIIQRVKPECAEICVFHAVEAPYLIPYYYVGTQEEIDAAEAKGRKRGEHLVSDAAARLAEAGFAVSSHVSEGDPRSAIINCAGECNADLIVMGSQGRTGLNRLLIGSVAEYVARHASCSVWIVRDTSVQSKQRPTSQGKSELADARHAETYPVQARHEFWNQLSKPACYVTAPIIPGHADSDVSAIYGAVLCDAIARHKRMCGFDVAFLSGVSRLNSQNSMRTVTIKPGVDEPSGKLLGRLHVAATHRNPIGSMEHAHAVQNLLRRTMRRSSHAIYKAPYEGRYCSRHNLDVSDSVTPANCPICNRPAELIYEERYFFRLSRFKDWLLALYEHHPRFIAPAAYHEQIRAFVQNGLKDICISTRPGNGIPWPNDSEHAVGKLYDFLTGYLSGIGFGEGLYAGPDFERFWPAELQGVNDGQLPAHAIYWPAFLMAADLPVPRHILIYRSQSANKRTENNSMDIGSLDQIIETLGPDAARYILLRHNELIEKEGFDHSGIVDKYNSELSSGLGSLASSILSMLERHCESRIPRSYVSPSMSEKIMLASWKMRAQVRSAFDDYDFADGLDKIWSLIATVDDFLLENDPAALAEDPSQKHRISNVLYDASQGLAFIVQLLHPILPDTTDRIWKALGQTTVLEDQLIDSSIWGILSPGTAVEKLQPLFPHADENKATVVPIQFAPESAFVLKKAV